MLCLEALLVSVGVSCRGQGGPRRLLWLPGGKGRGLWVSASCALGLKGCALSLLVRRCAAFWGSASAVARRFLRVLVSSARLPSGVGLATPRVVPGARLSASLHGTGLAVLACRSGSLVVGYPRGAGLAVLACCSCGFSGSGPSLAWLPASCRACPWGRMNSPSAPVRRASSFGWSPL